MLFRNSLSRTLNKLHIIMKNNLWIFIKILLEKKQFARIYKKTV
jgi:hypothetical protein